MRSIASLGLGLSMLLGLAASQPAAAWDDSYNRGADVYVHHHIYAPVKRVRHVYHIHAPGPSHVNVVYYSGNPYVWYYARSGYFAPRDYYRWQAYDGRW